MLLFIEHFTCLSSMKVEGINTKCIFWVHVHHKLNNNNACNSHPNCFITCIWKGMRLSKCPESIWVPSNEMSLFIVCVCVCAHVYIDFASSHKPSCMEDAKAYLNQYLGCILQPCVYTKGMAIKARAMAKARKKTTACSDDMYGWMSCCSKSIPRWPKARHASGSKLRGEATAGK